MRHRHFQEARDGKSALRSIGRPSAARLCGCTSWSFRGYSPHVFHERSVVCGFRFEPASASRGAATAAGAAPTLFEFDFTQRRWRGSGTPSAHIASLGHGAEGLVATLDGFDPYFSDPPAIIRQTTPLWVQLRLKSDEGGSAPAFLFQRPPREERSVRFHVAPGDWRELRVRLPALGPAIAFAWIRLARMGCLCWLR